MLPKSIVFLDVETTGASIYHDRIIEIGMLRVDDNHLSQTYQTLINPERYVPPEITRLTGIAAKNLENAPAFRQVSEEILELLSDSILAAHNARFDYSFLKNEFKRQNISFSPKQICTVKLSRQLYPGVYHHNLDSIIERFNLRCEKRHRAFDDAKILWDFYQLLQKNFQQDVLEQAIANTIKRPSLPASISQKTLDGIPETPGVYMFYGKSAIPLYVGKSKNIRTRVLSHFASDHTSSTEMKIAQQIDYIEVFPTCGELGALLKESVMIKKLQPLYNRQLRYSKKLVVLKKQKDNSGYLRIQESHEDSISPGELSDIIGIFKSTKSAETFLHECRKQYLLCEKMLGTEKTTKECFSYRLGQCKGACLKKENPFIYNARFILAFSKNKIKPWPFPGPIAIDDHNAFSNKKELFLIDKWCIIGNVSFDDCDGQNIFANKYLFDIDSYNILVRFLAKKENFDRARSITPQEMSIITRSDEAGDESILL